MLKSAFIPRIARAGLSVLLILSSIGRASQEAVDSARKEAERIFQLTGIKGGFVLHLGCGTGLLTAALHPNERYTVRGLEADPELVALSRAYIDSCGLYGPVSVDLIRGKKLPYVDNLINLVIVEKTLGVERNEIMRVLAPEGAACFKEDGGWQVVAKARSHSIDAWTHFLHDSGNNAVAADTEVEQPRSLQWVSSPLWLRSHETPSGIEGLVCSGKRLFYYFDEGIIGITDPRLPERWSLVCRDAFNGKLLWKKPLGLWGWPAWAYERFADKDWTRLRGARTVVPDENHRRIVVDGKRVYTTLRYFGPLVVLDAATGAELRTLKEVSPVRQLLCTEGVVLAYCGGSRRAELKRRRGENPQPDRLIALEGKTCRILWQKDIPRITGLFFGAKNGRVVYQAGGKLNCLSLSDGSLLWSVPASKGRARTLIVLPDYVVLYVQNTLRVLNAATGDLVWERRKVPASSGSESPDLFVVNGIVWRGMVPADQNGKPVRKSANALALGYDLKTGEIKRRIFVRNLRSPEHHHRCYRNKATLRYIISSMEGAEYLDLSNGRHCQNNWLRGACRLGMMPANGMLYVPADQCFCQPGAKILGFGAFTGPRGFSEVALDQRLKKGKAYGEVEEGLEADKQDWPTYRHDAARHGSTPSAVGAKLKVSWKAVFRRRCTQPIAVGEVLYTAVPDAHTIYALDARSGRRLWRFQAGGRVDSPPTYYKGLLLFGSADGWVYCVRAKDGALLWRFLAAPCDLKCGAFGQFESVWPVHGSVLIYNGLAYVAAGRSTYLDGGIRLWALDPLTGTVRYQSTVKGPFPEVPRKRDVAFYLLGARSDVLVAEGGFIYMRQKKFTPELKEIEIPVLSSKGAQDVGLHVFSTASLLDGSWYNRTYWMYAKRWPGFQLAQQAPKSGQLLVVDDEKTYAVKVFYYRNVHSPMFFPGRKGYLLYADYNTTEPQIVGEPGAKKPVEWLPQSHIPRPGKWGLDSPAFGRDKMIGYTRAEPPVWKKYLPIRIRAMVKAGGYLFVAGAPDVLDPQDPYAAFDGKLGAVLAVVRAENGEVVERFRLPKPPVFDGMIAARGKLYISFIDGTLLCYTGIGAR